MRISKKCIGLLVLVLGVNAILNYAFHSASYLRIVLHELQSSEDNFDIVFVGQSHGANAFNPYIIEEQTDLPTYNLCRGLVCNRDIYYLLKESNYKNDVKTIIYDIDSTYWTGFENPNYFADGYVYPHLNNPQNKIDYFFRYVIKENYRYNTCRYVVYGTGGLKAVPENIAQKMSKEYAEYNINSVFDEREKSEYGGRGYFAGSVKDDKGHKPIPWNAESVTEGSIQAFKDMVDYCKENNIEFICVSSPLPEGRVKAENYPEFHQYFEALAEEYDISFWDFNYINEKYLSWDDDDFQDSEGHMFGYFADEYSQVLGEIINQYVKGESVDVYFDNELD